jgi:ribonuclease BN (tRNA processing enzyme)
MFIEVIGANAAFTPSGMNTSFIIWKDKDKTDGVLVDCGFTILPELLKKGYVGSVKTVLLSHLHQDHCGSVITLLQCRTMQHKQKTMIGGTDWTPLLKTCLGPEDKHGEFITPFDNSFSLEKIHTQHIPGYMENDALFIMDKILYTGDCNTSLLETEQALKAKVIIHDAMLTPNRAHATVDEMAKAPAEVKAKTWLTHYETKDEELIKKAVEENGFAGYIKSGQIIEI